MVTALKVLWTQKKQPFGCLGGVDSNHHHVCTTSIFSKSVLPGYPAEHRLCN